MLMIVCWFVVQAVCYVSAGTVQGIRSTRSDAELISELEGPRRHDGCLLHSPKLYMQKVDSMAIP